MNGTTLVEPGQLSLNERCLEEFACSPGMGMRLIGWNLFYLQCLVLLSWQATCATVSRRWHD